MVFFGLFCFGATRIPKAFSASTTEKHAGRIQRFFEHLQIAYNPKYISDDYGDTPMELDASSFI